MGKTRGVNETTPEVRNRMVGMYEAGLGLKEIAAAINCSQRTVKRWLNRFDREGTVETRERCGRKRATTAEQDEAIIRLATQTPITAAKSVLPALGLTCSVDTIRERLHKAGIHNWSPSRKQIQKIPLGEADGAAIQHAVWRPTGTQIGKKKSQNSDDKAKKTGGKKKVGTKKDKSKDLFNEEPLKELPPQTDNLAIKFGYSQTQSIPQTSEIQDQTLLSDQNNFNNGLGLVLPPNELYHHPSVDVDQNWPLHLVQTGNHYSQSDQMIHEHLPPGPHLQELHTLREQQQVHQQIHHQMHHHHQLLEQQTHHTVNLQLPTQLEQPQNDRIHPEMSEIIQQNNSDSNSNDSNQYSSEVESIQQENSGENRNKLKNGKLKEKKKGGKAKGTLETSLEIRNRMIGMAQAGLSTLSIALTINRSERTVKRWLERWKKEGNVQTKERKGRKRITTKEQDEAIIAMATQQPLTAAKHVAPALGLKCSVDTIRERLHKAGIHSWKLGKKQGEGNAVHTIHLWQPSGNRPNKSKSLIEKKKKKPNKSTSNRATKRTKRKDKTDESPNNLEPPLQYHDSAPLPNYPAHNLMQPVDLPLTQSLIPPPLPHHHIHHTQLSTSPQSLPGAQSIIPQRSDCRLMPSIPPNNPPVTYSSCMVASNHIDQSDPLNYEPFIWTF